MQGALGLGGDLNRFTPEETTLATRLTACYKSVRTTVQHGRLYRLTASSTGGSRHVEFVSGDGTEAVLLSYLHSQHDGLPLPPVQLRGLDPAGTYRIRAIDGDKYRVEAVESGAVLMGRGVQPALRGDYDSTAIVLERQ